MNEMNNYYSKGVDVKLLSFEDNAKTFSSKQINIVDLLKPFFKKELNHNCIMINIESDTERYSSTLKELKKISINTFVHLKATYWKKQQQMIDDLNYVLKFINALQHIDTKKELYQYMITSNYSNVEINEFSEFNDNNIFIQDGPLACYISHLRSMIYGYLNFDDYTIIIEDDINITNTENIELYLKEIPHDWDIIFLNSAPKNKVYNEPWYKFEDEFHSCHFYIIRNEKLPFLIKNMYPIFDQVDVLVSNLFNKLNYYNITETVFQKNLSTNTQNNLHVILKSPYYDIVRIHIQYIENLLLEYINYKLIDNNTQNKIICDTILFDFIFDFIIRDKTIKKSYNDEKTIDIDDIFVDERMLQLSKHLNFILKCSNKGINIDYCSNIITKEIIKLIINFSLFHNSIDKNISEKFKLKALNYGSTSQVFLIKELNIIVKVYNDDLRYKNEFHNDSKTVFENEINLLKLTNKLIKYDTENKKIYINYLGMSLYDCFDLPKNWKKQLEILFQNLDDKKIFYPEFNLKNILILDEKISFIDYGLAKFDSSDNNKYNYINFLDILSILNNRLSKETENIYKHLLYSNFINNMKIHNVTKYKQNIF